MTVLVLAADRDPTADAVADELNRRRVPVFRCDPARFPDQLGLRAELVEGSWAGVLRGRHRVVDLADLRSVWYRGPALSAPPGGRAGSWEARLGPGGILADLPVLWVNHPAAEADAAYRPVQLAVAARCGLSVPPTLVSNCPDAIRRFADDQQRIVVEAPTVGSVRTVGPVGPMSPVGPVGPVGSVVEEDVTTPTRVRPPSVTELAELRDLGSTGHLFQRHIANQVSEARVTVVGRRLFGALARAGRSADHGEPDLRPVEVPRPVVASIGRVMSALSLAFAAFDLAVDTDDTWWFRRIDVTGEFRFVEDTTALPITAAITDLLERGRP